MAAPEQASGLEEGESKAEKVHGLWCPARDLLQRVHQQVPHP